MNRGQGENTPGATGAQTIGRPQRFPLLIDWAVGAVPGNRGAAATVVEVTALASEIPGSELVEAGLRDLAAGRRTVPALIVSIGAPRLRQLGFEVMVPIDDADHALYLLLAAEDPDGADSAHSRYNALVRRLLSFERAVACAS